MKRTLIGDLLWLSVLLIITALLVVPQTHQVFIHLTNSYPYGMGFIKFAILASMGEALALRLATRTWKKPVGMVYKVIVWGIIGLLITFMFSFYSAGIAKMIEQEMIPAWNGISFIIFAAFITSVTMNLTFGIVFMAMHRVSDTFIEMRINQKNLPLNELIATIKWDDFISFIVCKTIPFFWIPVQTVTFSLPAQYRVVMAAYLSIVLGVILVYAKKSKESLTGSPDTV